MSKINQTEQKEIGRIKLSDNKELIGFIMDNEKWDLRVFAIMETTRELLRETSDSVY